MNEAYVCEDDAGTGKEAAVNPRGEGETSGDKEMEKSRGDPCRERIERRRRKCVCKPKRRGRRGRGRGIILSPNPFIIFYLELYFKCRQGTPVTKVAREAGKKWYSLSDKERERYIRLAERESMKRCRSKRGRRKMRRRRRRIC